MVTVLFIAACQLPGSHPTCNAQIEWVNFVEVGSTQYVAGPESPGVLPESDLGAVYAHVKFRLSGNVCDRGYRVKDGDAAFLDAGTPIYQVTGHAPSVELAARFNGTILVYRRWNPRPRQSASFHLGTPTGFDVNTNTAGSHRVVGQGNTWWANTSPFCWELAAGLPVSLPDNSGRGRLGR
jgi:hypothetical protein